MTHYRHVDISERSALIELASRMAPDELIGGVAGGEYMRRWWIERDENGLSNRYLHQMMHSDDDRALHDHPWDSYSVCLAGELIEITADGRRHIGVGDVIWRPADFAHRLVVPFGLEGEAWTLFVTGPKVREWGFHCPNGWVRWQDYCRPENPGEIGAGCGP